MYLVVLSSFLVAFSFVLVAVLRYSRDPAAAIRRKVSGYRPSTLEEFTPSISGESDGTEQSLRDSESDIESSKLELVSQRYDPASLTRQLVLEYFAVTGVTTLFGPRRIPSDIEKRVRERLASRDLQVPPKVLEKHMRTGLDIATKAYGHTSSDLQVEIALCSLCATLFDDAYMGLEAMSQMVPRFHAGQPQMHPIVQLCIDTVTTGMRKHYGDYSANVIVTSWLDFANGEMLGRDTREMKMSAASVMFIEQIRLKDGIAEAYAAYIWPKNLFPDTMEYVQAIPDAMNHLNLVNDLFSFYKEELAGETSTYIYSYAKVHSKTIPQAMRSALDQILACAHRIKLILGEGEALDAWESFAAGYTQYHLHTPRYQLQEILPEYFHEL